MSLCNTDGRFYTNWYANLIIEKDKLLNINKELLNILKEEKEVNTIKITSQGKYKITIERVK